MIKKHFLFAMLSILFLSCQKKESKIDFTFFKWNIHESYYLKLNSSDTLYFINDYPLEKQTAFTILSEEEKERIQNTLDTLSFPKEKEYASLVDDGETLAFELKNKKHSKQLKIHGGEGPNQFWLFGKSLETIKKQHTFIKINKNFDLHDFNRMILSPIPLPLTCRLCPQP